MHDFFENVDSLEGWTKFCFDWVNWEKLIIMAQIKQLKLLLFLSDINQFMMIL